ncbi:hypothetical protein PG984_015515 [Apiospora sp. TS-2023a]
MSYDPQSSSRLFIVPIEIRRAIYADLIETVGVHMSLSSQGRFRLTRCFDPDLGAEHVGDERRPGGYSDPDDRIWARRLASTWGPHWQCEESALVRDEDEPGYYEILDCIKERVCFHVTDLETLGCLFRQFASSQDSSRADGFPELLRPPIGELHITLSLPLPFFEYFDDQPSAPGQEQAPLFKEKAELWATIPQNILAHLPSLRMLSIWLDHIQKPYWSVVHERHLLRPFEQLAKLGGHFDLSFDLPKLKPKIGGPSRLFLEEEDTGVCCFHPSSTPLQIRRRLRQRQRAAWPDLSKPGVVYYHDFPMGLGYAVWDGLSVAEIEVRERAMERHGVNLAEFLVGSSCGKCSIPALPYLVFGMPPALKDHAHLIVR